MTSETQDPYDVLATRCRHLAALLDGQDGWLTAFADATYEAHASEEEIPNWGVKQAQRVLAAQACAELSEKTLGWVIGGVVSRLNAGADIGEIEAEVAKRDAELSPIASAAAQEQVAAKREAEASQARLDALRAQTA